jgi:hypothetical protein
VLSIEQRLHGPVPARHHHAVVIALALTIGLRLALGDYASLAELPAAMFAPPWFLSWVHEVPSSTVLASIQAVGVAAVAGVAVTRGRRVLPFALAWSALLVLAGVQTSAGKILHNDVVLLLASIPFLLRVVPLDVRDDPGGALGPWVSGWAQRTAMVVVAIAYCASGVAKLRHSGLDWVTSDNLRWVLYAGARRESSMWPDLARFLADHAWMATTIAAATVVTEVIFPLAVFVRWLRPYLVAGVVALHVGVTVTLGLDYWTWVASVVILFTALPDRPGRVMARRRAHAAGRKVTEVTGQTCIDSVSS